MGEIFISYADEDCDRVLQIVNDLRANGISCWMSESAIELGKLFPEEIAQAIEDCKVFLLMVSHHSVGSEWVVREVTDAVGCRKPILPVLLEQVEYPKQIRVLLAGIERIHCPLGAEQKCLPIIISALKKRGVQARLSDARLPELTPTPPLTLPPPQPKPILPEFVLPRPSEAPRVWWLRGSIWAGIAVIAVLGLFVLWAFKSPRERRTPSHTNDALLVPAAPQPPAKEEIRSQSEDTVLIPGGQLHKGCWDDSATARLVRKLKLGENALNALLVPERIVEMNPFFLDQHEVTNAEYEKFLKEVGSNRRFDHPDQPDGHSHATEYQSNSKFNNPGQPVVGVDWFDSYAYATWAGKRLPTEDEWELAARGNDHRLYPWGMEYDEEKYEAEHPGGKGPVPVQQLKPDHPGGPSGMGGNVSEWTASNSSEKGVMIFRGGAWNHNPGELFALTFFSCRARITVRDDDLGFRCAKDAVGTPPPEMILVSGGQVRLGGEATPLLTIMRAYTNSIANIDEVFVKRYLPELVIISPFKLDRCEVSNAEYRQFLKAIQRSGDEAWRHPDQPVGKDHTPDGWASVTAEQDDLPVAGVDWFDAYAYAHWAGKRLPTNDEWEFAARGTTARLYPWGDTFDASRCVSAESGAQGPASVRSLPEGQSPYGILHLADNVMEWTDEDCGEGRLKALRGGSWNLSAKLYGLTYLRSLTARRTARDKNLGFRCAADANR